MSTLDDKLRAALGRVEPPDGFAERLLERLPQTPSNVVELPARSRKAPRFALAAAAALAVAAGSAWLAIPRGDLAPAPPAAPLRETAHGADEPGPSPGSGGFVPADDVTGHDASRKLGRRRARFARRASNRSHLDDREGRRAVDQLRLALHITSSTLNVARREMRDAAVTVPQS